MAIALSLASSDAGGASASAQIQPKSAASLPDTIAAHAQDEAPSLATQGFPPPQILPHSIAPTSFSLPAQETPTTAPALSLPPSSHTSLQEDVSAEDLLGLSAPAAVNAGVYAAPAQVLPVEAVAPDDATSATNASTPPLAQVLALDTTTPQNVSTSKRAANVDERPEQESGRQASAQLDAITWQGLEQFMESLGLSKYAQVLKQQEFADPEALVLLTDEDLKEMQVTIGARRKLLAAIKRVQKPAAS